MGMTAVLIVNMIRMVVIMVVGMCVIVGNSLMRIVRMPMIVMGMIVTVRMRHRRNERRRRTAP